jgi:hypothetical protein
MHTDRDEAAHDEYHEPDEVLFHQSLAHEEHDVHVGPIVKTVAIVFATLGATYLLMLGALGYLASREVASDPPLHPLAVERAARPPAPLLQINEPRDLALLRAAEDAHLSSYAWVDKQMGVVRMPIEAAMRRLLAKGLPAAPAESTDPAAAAALDSNGGRPLPRQTDGAAAARP